jgi:hypothetical protein
MLFSGRLSHFRNALFVVMLMTANARAEAPAGATTWTIGWGYGCGGNCAFRTEGKTVVEWNGADEVLDLGQITVTERSPGGTHKMETRWSGTWHGKTLRNGDVELERVASTCSESIDGKAPAECKSQPGKHRAKCIRKDVVAAGQVRRAWVCDRISEPSPAVGTPFPWVFSADPAKPIRVKITGEPRGVTSYE